MIHQKKLFSSKNFFFFNVIFFAVMVGFVLAFLTFSCSTQFKGDERVQAQEVMKDMPSTATLEEMQRSFRYVAQKALPVVVELQVVEVVRQQVPQQRGWPWNFLFPDPEGSPSEPEEREFRNQGLGSGVIVRNEGNSYYVITNNHVVGDAQEIKVILHDGKDFQAVLVGRDARRDIALVKFEHRGETLPVAHLGDSDDLFIGDWVLAVGSPFGYVSSVTAGIVSAKGRSGPRDNISDFIQTDAAINRGNSGGALVNIRGEVIGINTWIAAPTGGNVGLGFAIPINNVKRVISDLIDTGEVRYGWLGVTVTDISTAMAESLNLSDRRGAFISNVYLDSPGYKGGLRPGDVVLHIDGRQVRDRDQLVRVVGDLPAEHRARFRVFRSGREISLEITIGLRDASEAVAGRIADLWPGLTVVPVSEEIRKELDLASNVNGVLVLNAENRTKAQIAGIRSGDVIIKINDKPVTGIRSFYEMINDESVREIKINYLREGNELFTGIVR